MGNKHGNEQPISLCHRPDYQGQILKHFGETELPRGSALVTVDVLRMRNLAVGNHAIELSLPFAELKMLPADHVAGEQMQRGTMKVDTLNPSWEPPERYHFFVTPGPEPKILLSVYHHSVTQPDQPYPLGDGILHLKPGDYVADFVHQTVQLVTSEGKRKGEVDIVLRTYPPEYGGLVRHEIVYEFERWQPFVKWGNSYPGHLYPTDPGCWATVDGTKYGQKLHEVAAEVGDFIIKEDWHVIRTETDADGWEYGIDFPTLMWYPEVAGKKRLMVRRRTWHRTLSREHLAAAAKEIATKTETPATVFKAPTAASNK